LSSAIASKVVGISFDAPIKEKRCDCPAGNPDPVFHARDRPMKLRPFSNQINASAGSSQWRVAQNKGKAHAPRKSWDRRKFDLALTQVLNGFVGQAAGWAGMSR